MVEVSKMFAIICKQLKANYCVF